eukprot:TRINITY_DN10825_c1_g1_i7.p1 TRINITY_DN10825_c1_g1~~TRINITY_DN10825_c1_g1_i7.p1  ORF type:complete len:151 (+),score=36.85 TRINITY_DN10825_c1_g1_i7:82-534(+)
MPPQDGEALRSKGLLPALGVGAAVYIVTGFVSVGTLGLVGVGAGVGYGVGSWIAEKYGKKEAQDGRVSADQMPWAVQVALQQWQAFLTAKAAGRELSQADVDRIWMEFEQVEPTHAANARGVIMGSHAQSSSSSSSSGGPNIVPTIAAEV